MGQAGGSPRCTAEGDLTEAMIGRIAPAVDQLGTWLTNSPKARTGVTNLRVA